MRCQVCSTEFIPRRETQRTCSWACRGVWVAQNRKARSDLVRPCRRCGKSIVSRGGAWATCDDCRRPTRRCVVCGSEFRQRSTRAAGIVCSLACRGRLGAERLGHGAEHPNWKGGGGGPYHTHAWHRQRDAARERDGWRCVDCGKPRSADVRLHAHHLISRADWGDRPGHPDDIANLVTVCTGCHKKRHPRTGRPWSPKRRAAHEARKAGAPA